MENLLSLSHRVATIKQKKRKFNKVITNKQQGSIPSFLTLSPSSNFSPRRRGSKPDKGLSLVVGEPRKTYSTIFTPKPLVESLGLQINAYNELMID